MKKNKIIGLLASVACVATAAGASLFATSNVEASADFAGQNVSSFTMEYGAGVRIPTDDAVNGIRFTATLNKDVYAELEKLETETTKVNYGMLIVPRDWVDTYGALNAATVFGVGGNQVYTVETCENCTCGKKHISQVQADEMSVEALSEEDSTQVARLRGSIVNIQEGNETREFVGMAYIEYDQNGSKSYAFASYDDNNIDNNTRSMTYVTQLHLNDGGVDNDNALYNRYIQPYMEYEHKYTVEHYLPNAEGKYVDAPVIEEQWGTLNQTVNARNVAKFDNTKGEWATATMNNGDYLTSSPLYVNGNTVLKCYYKQVETTTLFDGGDTNDVTLLTAANNDDAYRTTTVETVEDSDKGTVVKVSSIDQKPWGDGYLDMQFDSTKLKYATDGNWDYLTITMKVERAYEDAGMFSGLTENLIAQEKSKIEAVETVQLNSNNILLAECVVGEWVDVVIPKAKFNTCTYKADGSVNWKSQLTAKGTLSKADFDSKFSELYETGSDYLFNIGTFSATYVSGLSSYATETAKQNSKACHDVRINYYIDKITWGGDYKAPKIQASTNVITAAESGAEVSYTPAYTVTDDKLPGKMTAVNGSVYESPIKSSHVLYEVSGDTRTALEATNGVYTLIQGNSYELEVTAKDWSVTDMEGNTTTKTYTLNVSSGATLSSFGSEADKALLSSSRCATDPTIEYMNTYSDKSGVVKMATCLPGSTSDNGGADLNLNFSELEAQEIINAFKNNDNFTLKVTVNFDLGKTHGNYSAFGIALHFGKTHYLAGDPNNLIAVNTKDADGNWAVTPNKMTEGNWYTLVLTKGLLVTYADWTTDDLIRQQLMGERYFMAFGNNWTVNGNSAAKTEVTYYLDEISYSVA